MRRSELLHTLSQRAVAQIQAGDLASAWGSAALAQALQPRLEERPIYDTYGDRPPLPVYKRLREMGSYAATRGKFYKPGNSYLRFAGWLAQINLDLVKAMGGTYYAGSAGFGGSLLHWPAEPPDMRAVTPAMKAAVVAAQTRMSQDPDLQRGQQKVLSEFATGKLADPDARLCRKCGGAGVIASFRHIEGGQCFDCGGSGLER